MKHVKSKIGKKHHERRLPAVHRARQGAGAVKKL
jgi:hypothetical protein